MLAPRTPLIWSDAQMKNFPISCFFARILRSEWGKKTTCIHYVSFDLISCFQHRSSLPMAPPQCRDSVFLPPENQFLDFCWGRRGVLPTMRRGDGIRSNCSLGRLSANHQVFKPTFTPLPGYLALPFPGVAFFSVNQVESLLSPLGFLGSASSLTVYPSAFHLPKFSSCCVSSLLFLRVYSFKESLTMVLMGFGEEPGECIQSIIFHHHLSKNLWYHFVWTCELF